MAPCWESGFIKFKLDFEGAQNESQWKKAGTFQQSETYLQKDTFCIHNNRSKSNIWLYRVKSNILFIKQHLSKSYIRSYRVSEKLHFHTEHI